MHALHAVDPLESWKLPAVHAVHSDLRAMAVYVPGAQGELVIDPTPHDEPAGQSVHSAAVARPTLLEKVPAKHGSCAEAPRGQKLPPSQGLHPVAPETSWKLPAVQAVHKDCLKTAVKVPGEQWVLDVDAVLQDEPAGQSVHSPALLRFGVLE